MNKLLGLLAGVAMLGAVSATEASEIVLSGPQLDTVTASGGHRHHRHHRPTPNTAVADAQAFADAYGKTTSTVALTATDAWVTPYSSHSTSGAYSSARSR